jgi:hypothetical protein
MVGDRKRNCILAVVPLAKAAAILTGYTNRMLALLGKPCAIDDPGIDGAVLPDHGQHQLKDLGQNRGVRPRRLTREKKKLLMFGSNLRRRRHRRQRFDALASGSRKRSPAVAAQRLLAILVADNARKPLDICLETRLTLLRCVKIHLRHPLFDARIIFIANSSQACLQQRVRFCDSVRLDAVAVTLDATRQ